MQQQSECIKNITEYCTQNHIYILLFTVGREGKSEDGYKDRIILVQYGMHELGINEQ